MKYQIKQNFLKIALLAMFGIIAFSACENKNLEHQINNLRTEMEGKMSAEDYEQLTSLISQTQQELGTLWNSMNSNSMNIMYDVSYLKTNLSMLNSSYWELDSTMHSLFNNCVKNETYDWLWKNIDDVKDRIYKIDSMMYYRTYEIEELQKNKDELFAKTNEFDTLFDQTNMKLEKLKSSVDSIVHADMFYRPNIMGTYRNHDYVDLGTGVLWATCNVGAENPWDLGNKYAWGSLIEYENDTNKNGEISEYYRDNRHGLKLEYDVANHEWGGNWQMPSYSDFSNLAMCHSEYTDNYKGTNVAGKIYYKKNFIWDEYDIDKDVHIFFPISDSNSEYWSSSFVVNTYIWCFDMNGYFYKNIFTRNSGKYVRPVCK